jgi:hypothetical protein
VTARGLKQSNIIPNAVRMRSVGDESFALRHLDEQRERPSESIDRFVHAVLVPRPRSVARLLGAASRQRMASRCGATRAPLALREERVRRR